MGTKGNTAGASAGPATGAQAKATYVKGMAVFVHAIGGLMFELAVGGQKFTSLCYFSKKHPSNWSAKTMVFDTCSIVSESRVPMCLSSRLLATV